MRRSTPLKSSGATWWNAATLMLGALGGCAGIERAQWKSQYLESASDTTSLKFTGELVERRDGTELKVTKAMLDEQATASATAGSVTVRCPAGYAGHAERLGELCDAALRAMQRELGLTVGLGLEAVVLEVEPSVSTLRFELPVEQRGEGDDQRLVATFPLLVREPAATAEALLQNNDLLFFVIVHELVEVTLILPQFSPTALPDAEARILPFVNYRSKNHTRWFRDGLSNYAALLALEALEEVAASGGAGDGSPHSGRDQATFSALDRVGVKLLRWDQYDPESWNGDYYNAATAVFLLIEHRHGRAAIREIVRRVGELEFPDGAAINRVVSDVLGQELAAVLEQVWLPDTGLTLVHREDLSERESPRLVIHGVRPRSDAADAGLLADKHLLYAVNGQAVRSRMDYELAMLRAAEAGQHAVTLDIAGIDAAGQSGERLQVTLPIFRSEPTNKPSRVVKRARHVHR